MFTLYSFFLRVVSKTTVAFGRSSLIKTGHVFSHDRLLACWLRENNGLGSIVHLSGEWIDGRRTQHASSVISYTIDKIVHEILPFLDKTG